MTTNAKPGSGLKKIDGVYHARLNAKGQSKWVSTGCDNRPEAEAVLAESGVERLNIVAKAGRLTAKSIGQILTGKNLTCAKALEKYAKLMATSKAAKTVSNNVLVVGNWMKEAKVESVPPSSVTAQHIDRWININDPKSGWKRSTRQVALGSVRTFFEFCASQGWIVADPSRQVALDYACMTHEQKEATEKNPFTEDEVKLLVKALTADLKLCETGKQELFREPHHVLFWLFAVRLSSETGLRLSDIAQLEWRSLVNLGAGKVILWMKKTNRRIEHTISPNLQEFIGDIPGIDADYVFPEQRAIIKDVTKRAGLSVQFARLCERIGIKGKSFHSLRHYKATSSYAKLDKDTLAKKLAGALSMEQIAALLGHASSKTSKRYVH
jgi:integrase